MRRLRFENSRGEVIEFDTSPFFINSLTGIGQVNAIIGSQKAPYQDGDTYIDSTLEPRYINLEGEITETGSTAIQIKKRELARICNAKLGLGKITLEINGEVYQIFGAIEFLDALDPVEDEIFHRFIITWKCPDPNWQDFTEENYKLEDFVASFKFPFHFPVRFATRGDSRILINRGDVPTPIQVEFRGPVKNPVITNQTTGEFIRVNREIPTGYKLILDTSFGNKQVDIIAPDGVVQNGFHFIDLESTFFSLDIGDNRIAFIADGGSPEVYVKYKNRYLSV